MGSSTSSRRPLRRIARWFGAFLALVAVIVVALAAIPVSTSRLGAEPEPGGSYAEAVDRFQASTDGEDGTVYEPCESILLDHGERTERPSIRCCPSCSVSTRRQRREADCASGRDRLHTRPTATVSRPTRM
jgi:hypothetical protein